MANKIKYIVHYICTPPDRYGNTYTAFNLVDTRSGRKLSGVNVPESNLKYAICLINGGEHKTNYYYVKDCVDKHWFDNYTDLFPYVGCCPETIAEAFKKAMKSRKKTA